MEFFFRKLCLNLKSFLKTLSIHVDSLRYGVDPIMTVEEYAIFDDMKKLPGMNYRYLDGAILTGLAMVDFFICLFCENLLENYRITKWWNVDEAIYQASSRIWFEVDKRQRELIIDIVYIIIFWTYFMLLRDKMKHHKRLFIVTKTGNNYSISQNDKILPEKLKVKLINFWLKNTPRMKIMFWIFYIQIILIYFVPLVIGDIFLPNEYSWGIRHIIYFVVHPYFTILITFFVLILYYFFVVCFCLKMKQRFLIRKINHFYNTKLRFKIKCNKRREYHVIKR